MRFSLFVLQILLDYVMLVSTGVATPAPGDANSPQSKAYLEERYMPSTNHHLDLPAPPPSEIAELPTLPTGYSDPAINLTTNLTAAQTIRFRVPHSTIELDVRTTKRVDGQILGNALLAMHEWLNDEIATHGDSTLADRKDDPFVWVPDGPNSRPRILHKIILGGSTLPVSLTAQSAMGEHMTYGVLLIAVEGLYLCLPSLGRDFGAQFLIQDWSEQALWGYGELKGL